MSLEFGKHTHWLGRYSAERGGGFSQVTLVLPQDVIGLRVIVYLYAVQCEANKERQVLFLVTELISIGSSGDENIHFSCIFWGRCYFTLLCWTWQQGAILVMVSEQRISRAF